MKKLLVTMMLVAASSFMIAPNHAEAKKHKKRVHHVAHRMAHHRVHTTSTMTSVDAQRSSAVAAETAHPHTVPQRVASGAKRAGHSVSYETWRLTHPNQARAEYDAEAAADAKREARYHKTH